MKEIIGREKQAKILDNLYKSNQSELLVVYGRRRVGKTFLIREHYQNKIIFELTGLFQGKQKDQLQNFTKEINKRNACLSGQNRQVKNDKTPKNWLDAFSLLEKYIEKLKTKRKKVIFIDEFPWVATARSKFLMAFENFWNSFATKRTDLVVVVCGSSASYMIQKIIKNKGGLHNRITKKIRLLPFNLYETKKYLKYKNISYTHYDILQLYMAIGGVPQYLNEIQKGLSVAQNIDNLCFDKDGFLYNEFNEVFASLFKNSEKHLQIIKALATIRKGITRKELSIKSKVSDGGDFTLKLEELVESGFISEYTYYTNKKKNSLFRLSDEYSMFYLKFIAKNKTFGKGVWQNIATSSSFVSWSGFSFEAICLKHIDQIKKALNIQSIFSTNSAWFNKNAQIDLMIDRADNIINLCELKFSKTPFTITSAYHKNLKNKKDQFYIDTNTRKNINITMITTFGITENKYSLELVENELNMNVLFLN